MFVGKFFMWLMAYCHPRAKKSGEYPLPDGRGSDGRGSDTGQKIIFRSAAAPDGQPRGHFEAEGPANPGSAS